MRVEKSSFSEVVDTRPYHCMKSLIALIRSQHYFENSANSRQIFMLLMNYLLINTVYISSPFSCIDLDAFSLLVTLILTVPSFFNDTNFESNHELKDFLVATGSSIERNIIEMIHVFHMIQVCHPVDGIMLWLYNVAFYQIIVTNPNMAEREEPMEVDPSDSESSGSTNDQQNVLLTFCKDIWCAAGHINCVPPTPLKANYFIKSSMLPFLRSTAMFTFFHSEVRLPRLFWEKSKPGQHRMSPTDEYDMLCGYLGIPKDFCILLQRSLKQLGLSWMRHSKIKNAFTTMVCSTSSLNTNKPGDLCSILEASSAGLKQPHSINILEILPYDYSDLLNSVVNFTCPNSKGSESRSPSICLVCGHILCSQNYCCQKMVNKEMIGACTFHALNCGAGTGLFLRIRECKLLLLAGKGRG